METKIFATFDQDGYPSGFYPEDVWPENQRPADAVEITADQYDLFMRNQGYSVWRDGDVVVLEQPVPEV